MKKHWMVKATCGAALAALIAMAAGCATSAYNKAGSASVTSDKAAEVINKGNAQLDVVLTALTDLLNNPGADLKPQFSKFMSATKQLESLAEDVASRASAMKNRGTTYFQQWDVEIAKIQNEDIRKSSQDRKKSVVAKFDAVNASCEQVKADFTPFISDIKDIRTALSADLTVGGLSAIKGAADKANKNAVPLRRSLTKLSEDFKELSVSLSANMPAQPAPAK